jgi:hypothetical protein
MDRGAKQEQPHQVRENMKLVFRIFIIVIALASSATAAAGLPWPQVVMGKMALPFGLEWFMEGAKEKIVGFGEPQCGERSCLWMSDRPEGTVSFVQTYHYGTLVGLRMDYILTREAGLPYREKMKELKESLEDWSIQSGQDQLMQVVNPDESFVAESKDTRLKVTYREGEHSITISLDIQAK